MKAITTDDLDTFRRSGLFDEEWYLEQYPDVRAVNIDPALHYLRYGVRLRRPPSPKHSEPPSALLESPPVPVERDYLNEDAARAATNPLLRYARTGHQRWDDAKFSRWMLLDPDQAPSAAEQVPQPPSRYTRDQRVAIFAFYSAEALVDPYVEHYLRELNKHVEKIVFVADTELLPAELAKLNRFITHAVCEKHGEYDFGSYKRGYRFARENGYLDKAKHLIFCNDSCLGPFDSFDYLFQTMEDAGSDFWGITDNYSFRYHIQSYFLSFNERVFRSDQFVRFLNSVKRENTVRDVILNYETQLTLQLQQSGFSSSVYLPQRPESSSFAVKTELNTEHFPILMMRAGAPLIKKKALLRSHCNRDGASETIAHIEKFYSETAKRVLRSTTFTRYKNSSDVGFSIILPTKNRRDLVTAAIKSALGQYHTNFEIIVVDDGSTDGTNEHLHAVFSKEIAARTLVYKALPESVGVCAARNVGLSLASKDWIAYLDSDNEIRPHFLSVFAQAVVEYPHSSAFYGKFQRYEDATVGGKPFSFKDLIRANFIDLGVFVHGKNCLDEIGGFDEALRRLVDWDLIISISKLHSPVFINNILLDYSHREDKDRISVKESLSLAKIQVLSKHSDRPTVSTIVLSYNHADSIEQAIESVLAQRGDFEHEVILADDGSTDGTPEVVDRYVRKFPALCRRIGMGPNVGISENFRRSFQSAGGRYVAILEGDDYWSRSDKISRQVCFLEENNDCTMVFSKILVDNVAKNTSRELSRQSSIRGDRVTAEHFLAHPSMNLIGNFSCCMFRTHLMRIAPEVLYRSRFNEIAVAFYLDNMGPIGYIDEVMSVYRQHPQGVWSGSDRLAQLRSGLEARLIVQQVAREKFKGLLGQIVARKRRELLRASERAVA